MFSWNKPEMVQNNQIQTEQKAELTNVVPVGGGDVTGKRHRGYTDQAVLGQFVLTDWEFFPPPASKDYIPKKIKVFNCVKVLNQNKGQTR